MSTILTEGVSAVPAAHTNDQPESALPTGLHAYDCVFDHDCTLRVNSKLLRCPEKRVRLGLTREFQASRNLAIDPHIKQVPNPCSLEDRLTVLARRDDGRLDPLTPEMTDERHGTFVGLHPLRFPTCLHLPSRLRRNLLPRKLRLPNSKKLRRGLKKLRRTCAASSKCN